MDLNNPKTLSYSKGDENSIVALLLVYFLLCVSGNPALASIVKMEIVFIVFAIVLAVLMFLNKGRVFNQRFLTIAGIFSIIFLFQIIIFSFFPYFTIAGFYVRLFIGFAVIRLVKGFPLAYIQVMFYLAIVSLCFHIPDQLGQYVGFNFRGIFAFLGKIIGGQGLSSDVIYFHTFMNLLPERNAGMFWEPGAFAGYLIVAIGFLGLNKDKLPKVLYVRFLIVLSLTLLTTKSTTGYLVFPFALLTHLNFQKAKTLRKGIVRFLVFATIFPLSLVIIYMSYHNIEFLFDKVKNQRYQLENRGNNWHKTRFGTLALDWKYIKERPLTGWGPHPKTRYAFNG